MGIHKNSKAETIRKYVRSHPEQTYKEVAEKNNATINYVRSVMSIAKLKASAKRKLLAPLQLMIQNKAGIKLNGGYYTLDKLKEIVNALETLNKLMAKETNE